MRRVGQKELKPRDTWIASVTVGDQMTMLDRVAVAQHLPADVALMLVHIDGDCELWARGPKASVENARHFVLGWKSCLENAVPQ
jgi:hypothetical protein